MASLLAWGTAAFGQSDFSLLDDKQIARLATLPGTDHLRPLLASSIESAAASCRCMVAASRDELLMETHKLKGSSGTVRFSAITAVAERIERAAQLNQHDPRSVDVLALCVASTLDALRARQLL